MEALPDPGEEGFMRMTLLAPDPRVRQAATRLTAFAGRARVACGGGRR
jgi:hypothetical protein